MSPRVATEAKGKSDAEAPSVFANDRRHQIALNAFGVRELSRNTSLRCVDFGMLRCVLRNLGLLHKECVN
jgi:hypothetical protein